MDLHESPTGSMDGPRPKKARTDAPRPMCTNCEQCQLRKGKCDGGRPVCGWCAANNKPCVYQEKKKPGLKAGYGRDLEKRLTSLEETLSSREDELEQRVEQLQEQLEQQASMLESLRSSMPVTNMPAQVSSAAQASGIAAVAISPPLNAAGLTATGSLASSYNASNAIFSNHASPATSSVPSVSQGESMLAHRVPPNSTASTHRTIPPVPGAPDAGADVEVPPLDLTYDLMDLYFQHINPWFPLLDRKSTMNKILRSNSEEDLILVHAIIAISMRFYSQDTAGAWGTIDTFDAQKRKWHAIAKNKVIFHSFEKPSIRRLQALTLMALDMTGEQNGGPGTFILASIARCASQLGLTSESLSLNTSPDYPTISTLRATVLPESRDWLEDESRRRLFWLIYMLDRDTTITTSLDFVIDETTVDRKLPCKDEFFGANRQVDTRWFRTSSRSDYSMDYPENLEPFAHLIELKGLVTKIHHFLKKLVNINSRSEVEVWRHKLRDIDGQLSNWRNSLPFDLRNVDQVLGSRDNAAKSNMWLLLQLTYYTHLLLAQLNSYLWPWATYSLDFTDFNSTFIRLHSPAAYPPHKTPIFKPSASAAQQCYAAVEKIVALVRYMMARRLLNQQGPATAFSLWVAARVMLVHGAAPGRQVSGEIFFLLRALVNMGEYWPVAKRYGQVLQRVVTEYKQAKVTAGTGGANETSAPQPHSVTILADMRRCAYDLDMMLTNEPLGQSSSTLISGWSVPAGSQADQSATSELDYLETFNFFNYPRMPTATIGQAQGLEQVALGPGQLQGVVTAQDAGFNVYNSPPDGTTQASLSSLPIGDMGSDWMSAQFA